MAATMSVMLLIIQARRAQGRRVGDVSRLGISEEDGRVRRDDDPLAVTPRGVDLLWRGLAQTHFRRTLLLLSSLALVDVDTQPYEPCDEDDASAD